MGEPLSWAGCSFNTCWLADISMLAEFSSSCGCSGTDLEIQRILCVGTFLIFIEKWNIRVQEKSLHGEPFTTNPQLRAKRHSFYYNKGIEVAAYLGQVKFTSAGIWHRFNRKTNKWTSLLAHVFLFLIWGPLSEA